MFTAQLTSNLLSNPVTAAAGSVASSGGVDPSKVALLPAAVKTPYRQAFTDSIGTVFFVAAGAAVLAFALAWLIEERPLRETVTTSGVGEAFASPTTVDPLREIGRARYREDPTLTFDGLRALHELPLDALETGRRALVRGGYAQDGEGGTSVVTPAGVALHDQLRSGLREHLAALLDGWSPEQYPDLERLLSRLAESYTEQAPAGASR